MKTEVHYAGTRGHADHGWLDTYHTFSFADYYDPGRIHFGALRVLNDDTVEGGRGFGKHPHDNMEIVTVMLEGELLHADSMGHTQVLHPDEVQVMSAGTGIFHSEMNNLPDRPVRLLQIWVFPEERNIKPRYDQKLFDREARRNRWQLLAAPGAPDGALDLKQQSWFSRIELDKDGQVACNLHGKDHGLYLFIIRGSITVGDNLRLGNRDGAGFWETPGVTIKADSDSDILAIEVPME